MSHTPNCSPSAGLYKLFVYTRIRDFLQHEFLFGFIQCMFADERTIICSYSVRTGAINRTPTPMECTLQLFMCK